MFYTRDRAAVGMALLSLVPLGQLRSVAPSKVLEKKLYTPQYRDVVVEVEQVEENGITFQLRNADTRTANVLRKILLSYVPTLAIDLVNIETNTSLMLDEELAYRLGLVPLQSSKVSSYAEECTCTDFCPLCSASFDLDITCIENIREVTTLDLLPREKNVIPVLVDEQPILLARLRKGQSLRFTAVAKRGLGTLHTKWSPVTLASFSCTDNSETGFTFYVETTGSLPPTEILETAYSILKSGILSC